MRLTDTEIVAKKAAQARRKQAAPSRNGRHDDGPSSVGPDEAFEAMPLPPERPRLCDAAYFGPVGEAVKLIEPETEADPAGIYLQLLAAVGNAMRRGPYYQVEGDRHHTNLFVVLVGETSRARKGTSWGRVRQVMGLADPEWTAQHVVGGLTSGEGLIRHVRDARGDDPGSEIKNVLVCETELGSLLKRMARQGNTLSAVLRQAWDGVALGNLTKENSDRAANALVSIVGHVTAVELADLLGRAELFNGWANRFLWAAVGRSRLLPLGGKDIDLRDVSAEVKRSIEYGQRIARVGLTAAAARRWAEVYAALDEPKPGILGPVTDRAPAHVLRLALLNALQDLQSKIDEPHLEAAFALWNYCAASAVRIFGDADPAADLDGKVFEAIEAKADDGATRTDVYAALHNHVTKKELIESLGRLRDHGRIAQMEGQPTGGRKAERWRAVKAANDAREANDAKKAK